MEFMFEFVLVIFMDDVCENIYLLLDINYYLVWDGIYFSWDFFMNFLDGFIIIKDFGSCKVSFEFVGIFSFNMCVIVEEFYIEDCNVIVNYYYYGDFERKVVIIFFFLILSIFVCIELLYGV